MAVFRVNEPDVVYETFDDEIVVVNLDTGNYYSLSGTGPAIWADLAGGFDIDEIATRIQCRYTGGTDAILTAVTAFADRLVGEKLLIGAGDPVVRAQKSLIEPAATMIPFEPPLIENYEDMQDLLMLDPIHEVDTAGWPVIKKNVG
jgi:coenzyme PQQ synthesis protein D (PqqD)